MVRAGRVRVQKLEGAEEFSALIAPDVQAARNYLAGQPMGSYILVVEAPRRMWKPTQATVPSLSVMVRYRAHEQLARVPLGSSSWFHKPTTTVEWRLPPDDHIARLSGDAFVNLSFYWRDFLPHVSIKVSEICQDPSLVTPPTNAAEAQVQVPAKLRGLGVVLVVNGTSYPVRFDLKGRRIDVRLPPTGGWFVAKRWSIPHPWNLTFADIKDVVCMPTTFVPKLRRASIENLMYTSAHAPEPPPADAAELDLLVAIQVHVERIAEGSAALQADLAAWLALPSVQPLDDLLPRRLDAVAAVLLLHPHRAGSKRSCAPETAVGATAFVLRVAQVYEAHSIGLEKLVQLVLLRLDEHRNDIDYLFGLLHALFTLPDVPRVFFHNHGVALVMKQYRALLARRPPSRCVNLADPSEGIAALSAIQEAPPPAFQAAAQQAARCFSHRSAAFVHAEFTKGRRDTERLSSRRSSTGVSLTATRARCTECAADTVNPLLEGMLDLVQRALEPLLLLDTVLCEANWPRTLELEVDEMLYWEERRRGCFQLLPPWLRLFALSQRMMAEECVGEYVIAALELPEPNVAALLRLLPKLLSPFRAVAWPPDGLARVLMRLSQLAAALPRYSGELFAVLIALLRRLDAPGQNALLFAAWAPGAILVHTQAHAAVALCTDAADVLSWCADAMAAAPTGENRAALIDGFAGVTALVLATPLAYTKSASAAASNVFVDKLRVIHGAAKLQAQSAQGAGQLIACAFLQAFYEGDADDRASWLWRCALALAPCESPLIPFVTYALFPFGRSRAPERAALPPVVPQGTRTKLLPAVTSLAVATPAGIPLLNLALALKPATAPTGASAAATTELAPALRAADGRLMVDFVAALLDFAIDANNAHLRPSLAGRFAAADQDAVLGLDLLFQLPRLLEAEADVLAAWLPRYPPWAGARSSRLRAQERLLKLSSTSFSRPSLYFKEFAAKAHGAFGTIYKCTAEIPLRDAESLAIKLLAPQSFAHERSVLGAVYNEVLVLERLRGCPAAIQMLDYGVSADGYYIAMEYAPYNLKEWWAAHAQLFADPFKALLAIFAEVCAAVAQIHAAHVTHLDVKCENVLLRARYWPGSGGGLCMGDFGESYLNMHPRDPEFDCLHARGTEAIRSPEMLESSNRISAASDVWSLGCLLFELVTGEYMFSYEDWSQFYAHLRHSSVPVVTPAHEDAVRNSLFALHGNVDVQSHVINELLRFMLVRSVAARPTLSAIQRLLATLGPDIALELRERSPRVAPSAPTTYDAMHHRVRIDYASLASKMPTRYHVHVGLVVALSARDVLPHETALHLSTNSASLVPIVPAARPAKPVAREDDDGPNDDAQLHYVVQLLAQAPVICARLWELHTAHTPVALVVSAELAAAAQSVLYLYKMSFFGLAGFEAVKEAQRAMNAYGGYTPSPRALAHVFLWEEKRERAVVDDAIVFQCFCGQCALAPTRVSSVVCCGPHAPCGLCAWVADHMQNAQAAAYGATYPLAWLLAGSVETLDLLQLPAQPAAFAELVADLPDWAVYRCVVCKVVTHAVEKATRTVRHVAAIPAGPAWRAIQRRYYFTTVAC
ncbi:hypothetical protein ACHHYP_13746 [Achlya hypogyna]|uniref:non-specific serine/threonine protein kinase n=1 Tax=Achlya hypogyna TaxID=1202772 RepID=A0A1V9YEV8_ACHHY|nr:hypothetical protein ACHHYP_13746 [Achlya hypogyna]